MCVPGTFELAADLESPSDDVHMSTHSCCRFVDEEDLFARSFLRTAFGGERTDENVAVSVGPPAPADAPPGGRGRQRTLTPASKQTLHVLLNDQTRHPTAPSGPHGLSAVDGGL